MLRYFSFWQLESTTFIYCCMRMPNKVQRRMSPRQLKNTCENDVQHQWQILQLVWRWPPLLTFWLSWSVQFLVSSFLDFCRKNNKIEATPAVSLFCSFTAISLTVCYILHITIFTALYMVALRARLVYFTSISYIMLSCSVQYQQETTYCDATNFIGFYSGRWKVPRKLLWSCCSFKQGERCWKTYTAKTSQTMVEVLS